MSKHINQSKIIFHTLVYLEILKMNCMSEIQLSDRIRMAHTIKVESAMRRKVSLKVCWYDVHGENHTQNYLLNEGSIIEL